MRCWVCVMPIVMGMVQGCAAPLVRSVRNPGVVSGGTWVSFDAWPFVLAAVFFMMAALVGGIGAMFFVRRQKLSRALKLRSGQAPPGELEKLQQALDLIEDVMAAMRGPGQGPGNRGD